MKLKIDKHLQLTDQEIHLVLMHSILNILGVLIYNVKELGKMSRDPQVMKPVIETLTSIREKLDDRDFTNDQLSKFDELHEYLSQSFVVIYESYPDLKEDEEYKKEVDNIYLVLSEMRRRAEEIVEWQGDPFRVAKITPEELREDMEQFFEAVQRNSRGAYKVIFSSNDHKAKMTYRMDFDIAADHDQIEIPMVYKDVIRDVLANARKYSLPGSKIEASFVQKNGQTKFSCKDEGVGIPEVELSKVTDLYYRASSGKARETMGKGVGLTKAHYVTQKLGGTMWITSELSGGTTVEIIF
ncbi:MAG: ATP-binding protein [Cyclobacteriaceae bacterium]